MRKYALREEEGFMYPESEIDERMKDIEHENAQIQEALNRETDRYDALLGVLRIQPDPREGTLEEWGKWAKLVEGIITDEEGRRLE